MQERKQEISVDTYNSIIHTCTQAGDMTRAEQYLEHMEDCGLEPNLVSYNSVINACADQGDAARAEQWLHRMVARGMKPNLVTYGTICKVFARQGGVQQIVGIMKMLEDGGTPLNEYFYASLISACGACTPPDPSRAERSLAELVQRGLRPHSVKRALARVVGDRRTAQLLEQVTLKQARQPSLPGHSAVEPSSASCHLSTQQRFLGHAGAGNSHQGQHRPDVRDDMSHVLVPGVPAFTAPSPFPMAAPCMQMDSSFAFAPLANTPARAAAQASLEANASTAVPDPSVPTTVPTPFSGCPAADLLSKPSTSYVKYVPGATLLRACHLATAEVGSRPIAIGTAV
jgi:pentatricopeptide repeat protein